jgi:hypothetical protein
VDAVLCITLPGSGPVDPDTTAAVGSRYSRIALEAQW